MKYVLPTSDGLWFLTDSVVGLQEVILYGNSGFVTATGCCQYILARQEHIKGWQA